MYVACRSRLPRPRIPDRGPRVRMGGCLLDIAERDPGVQGGGDERVPKRVGRDGLADPDAAGGLTGRRRKEETFWCGEWMVTALQVVRADACGVAGGARRHRRARCRLRRGHEGAAGDSVCGGCWAAAGRGDDRAVGPDARPYRRLARTRRDGEGPAAASGALLVAARGPLAGSVPAAWLLWHL